MPPENRIFLDPNKLIASDLPLIVLADDLRGFIGWAIKSHTSGNYNHAMIMHKPGLVATQDFSGFNEKSINKYLMPSQMLKFWRLKDMTNAERAIVLEAINKRMALPWYRKMYDYVGTFIGQFLKIKWIQSPFQEFCSEEVRDDFLELIARISKLPWGEPSPSDLDRILKKYPDIFEVAGYWWSET